MHGIYETTCLLASMCVILLLRTVQWFQSANIFIIIPNDDVCVCMLWVLARDVFNVHASVRVIMYLEKYSILSDIL